MQAVERSSTATKLKKHANPPYIWVLLHLVRGPRAGSIGDSFSAIWGILPFPAVTRNSRNLPLSRTFLEQHFGLQTALGSVGGSPLPCWGTRALCPLCGLRTALFILGLPPAPGLSQPSPSSGAKPLPLLVTEGASKRFHFPKMCFSCSYKPSQLKLPLLPYRNLRGFEVPGLLLLCQVPPSWPQCFLVQALDN